MKVHFHVQSHKVSHMPASSTVYFTVQDCMEYGSTESLFQVQDVQKQVETQWYIANCVRYLG